MATPRARSSSSQTAIRALFEASARAREVFLQENADALERAIDLIADALAAGRKLLLFGNGGSAADAQHLAAELVGRFQRERRPLPAIALTTDTSALTAIANDYGYDEVFARQVRALGAAGDVALAISTSGRSPACCARSTCAGSSASRPSGSPGATAGRSPAWSISACACPRAPTRRASRRRTS